MQRIYTENIITSFQDEDITTDPIQEATRPNASWLNSVQEEIASVIEGAHIELDKKDNGQLLQAIKKLTKKQLSPAKNGVSGLQGPQGEMGPIGDNGPMGLRGNQGPQGRRGSKGKRGPSGSIGLQGPQGARGEVGIPHKDWKDAWNHARMFINLIKNDLHRWHK